MSRFVYDFNGCISALLEKLIGDYIFEKVNVGGGVSDYRLEEIATELADSACIDEDSNSDYYGYYEPQHSDEYNRFHFLALRALRMHSAVWQARCKWYKLTLSNARLEEQLTEYGVSKGFVLFHRRAHPSRIGGTGSREWSEPMGCQISLCCLP